MNLEQFSVELEELVARVALSVVGVEAGGSTISGLVVKPEHVLSLHHVLERNDDVNVVGADGSFKGAVVGRDRRSDLALVRVPGLTAQPLTAQATARVGALNLMVARTGRGNLSVSQGIVALNSGMLEMGRGRFRLEGLLRSSAEPFSGISGAPMVNAKGELIGLVNASLDRGSCYALPAGTVLEIASELEKGGGLKRGYLGVGMQPVQLESGQRAVLVNSVEPGSPAAQAGVMIGDVLLKFNGQSSEGMRELMLAVSQSVGMSVPLELQRGGQTVTLQITVSERPVSENTFTGRRGRAR